MCVFNKAWSADNPLELGSCRTSTKLNLASPNLIYVYLTLLNLNLFKCVPESVLGGLVGVSAVVGTAGSLAYPHLRKKIGLEKTGLTGFGCLLACLLLPVASIWLPGSPFESRSNPLRSSDQEQLQCKRKPKVTLPCGTAAYIRPCY